MIKKTVLLLFVFIMALSCSSKKEGPFYIESVRKVLPEGKIKLVKKGEVAASMTHKTLLQKGANEKHILKSCQRNDLTFIKFENGKIHVDAVHRDCSTLKETKRENFIIPFKNPCVFRFETIMIQVVKVDENEFHYRIIRDRG